MRTISKELYEKLKGNANQPVEYTIQQNLNGQEYTRELVDEILNKLDGYLADAEMPEIVVYYGESTHIIIEDSEVINGFQEELEHEQQQAQLENMDINIITAVISEFFKGRHERGWTSRTTSALANATHRTEAEVDEQLSLHPQFHKDGERWRFELVE